MKDATHATHARRADNNVTDFDPRAIEMLCNSKDWNARMVRAMEQCEALLAERDARRAAEGASQATETQPPAPAKTKRRKKSNDTNP